MTEPTRRAPLSADLLPASGAWRPGDPVGGRQFLTVAEDRPFVLEGGGQLRDVTVAYETWGDARRRRRQRRAGVPRPHRRQPRRRPQRPRPPHRRAGGTTSSAPAAPSTPTAASSCASTCSAGARARTGPASIDPDHRPAATARPSRWSSIRDMVRTQARVADHLGIDRWLAVVGGSMGGMQVAGVGRHVPRPGAGRWSPSPRTAAATRPADRLARACGAARSPSTPSGAAATTTTPRPATVRTRAWPLARQIAQITYRSDAGVQRAVRSRAARPARRPLRAVAALRGRGLPRLPRRQAGPPLRRQLLPAAQPRPWTCTTSAAAAAASTARWPHHRARA